jgi:hypothetical protein
MANMESIVRRWQAASERALDEGVRIVQIDGRRYATSSSQPLGAYELTKTADGWACSCIANREYGMPCKHLAALADALGLDLLSDTRIDWNALEESEPAHAGS